MNRRQYLSYTGLAVVTATAGCLGSDDDDSEPAGGDATGDDADSANGESAETPPEFEDGPSELGEGIVFYTDPGDAEISFTPFEASFSSVIVDEANGRPV
ncbi:hypothetical protein [Natronorubrum thiooxidans]|uniref:Uncharacterized protein n=1 Tax=Natronorubrum thiooxidans TaxID=308853 RepID=A0A1N7F051_9EURY|nr:hypothetical protein [Natronorubrum thiooxidans]SIR93728.1 hypothetical protein SAMN05421752_105223 [Natronorubrum thiooxidans]